MDYAKLLLHRTHIIVTHFLIPENTLIHQHEEGHHRYPFPTQLQHLLVSLPLPLGMPPFGADPLETIVLDATAPQEFL